MPSNESSPDPRLSELLEKCRRMFKMPRGKAVIRCEGSGRLATVPPNGIGHQCPVCGVQTIPYPNGSVRIHNPLPRAAAPSQEGTVLLNISELNNRWNKQALDYVERERTAAAVLLGGTPQPLPDDPPTVLTIEVEREDDGRCCASWVTGDRKEAGSGEYSPTIVGALANLCATLIKVDEDKAIERAACGGAASSPTPEIVGAPIYDAERSVVYCPGCKAVLYRVTDGTPRVCGLAELDWPAAPVRPETRPEPTE